MKKIKYILLVLLIFPFVTYASSIEQEKINYEVTDVYMNSSIDILGSMHIKEAIVVKGSLNKFSFDITYKDSSLEEWKEKKVDLEKSSFYNARGLSIKTVSSFKTKEKDISFDLLDKYKDIYEEKSNAKNGSSKAYTIKKNNDGIKLSIYNPNDSGYMVYYVEYYIDQAVVLHNDIAELYYKFIPNSFDDINKINIQVLFPGNSPKKLTKYWAHGTLSGSIGGIPSESSSKLEEVKSYQGILAVLNNIKSGKGVTLRLLFDKDLMKIGTTILNNSKQDAFDDIVSIENRKINESKKARKINEIFKYMIIVISAVYLITLCIIVYFNKKSSFDKLVIYLFTIFGTILSFINIYFNISVVPLGILTSVFTILFIVIYLLTRNKNK